MLEATDARHRVERAEAVAGDLPRVVEVDVETVPPTGSHLRGGQRDADPGATSVSDEIQQRPPPAAEIEHPATRSDADLLGHILVLAPLGLLEAQGEITVVLGAAEVRELSQTEPEDAIDQRIGELDIRPVSHPDPIVILPEPTIDPVRPRGPRGAGAARSDEMPAAQEDEASRLAASISRGVFRDAPDPRSSEPATVTA